MSSKSRRSSSSSRRRAARAAAQVNVPKLDAESVGVGKKQVAASHSIPTYLENCSRPFP